MRGLRLMSVIVACAAAAQAYAMPDCSLRMPAQPEPMGILALPALTSELPTIDHAIGTSDALLADQTGQGMTVDRVLARLRAQSCTAANPAGPAAGYVPRTKWDNTPYRFSAGGNGKKFTAADFDAWMKANGIHVSKGVPQPAQAAQPASSDAAAQPSALPPDAGHP